MLPFPAADVNGFVASQHDYRHAVVGTFEVVVAAEVVAGEAAGVTPAAAAARASAPAPASVPAPRPVPRTNIDAGMTTQIRLDMED